MTPKFHSSCFQILGLVPLEKSTMLDYSLPNSLGGEAKVIKQAGWIKERAPDKAVLFYTCSMGWNLAPSEGSGSFV